MDLPVDRTNFQALPCIFTIKSNMIASCVEFLCSCCCMVIAAVPLSLRRRDISHYCTACGAKVGSSSGLLSSGIPTKSIPAVGAVGM